MMKISEPLRIFVSRPLGPESLFRQLDAAGHTVIGQSLIEFEDIAFEVPPHDAVFFYSQRAILPYLQATGYSTDKAYGVMGPASQALFIKQTGHRAQIEGKGEGQADYEALESSINSEWAGKEVLFPVASRSMKRFKNGLPDLIQKHLVIYNNKALEKIDVPYSDILAFTSPLNVEAYCSSKKIEGTQALFAIGQTTAKKLSAYTVKKVQYCEDPSEANLYQLIADFISSS